MNLLSIKNNPQYQKDIDRFNQVIGQLDGHKKFEAEKLLKRFTEAIKRIDDTLVNVSLTPVDYSFHAEARQELKKIRVSLENLLQK